LDTDDEQECRGDTGREGERQPQTKIHQWNKKGG